MYKRPGILDDHPLPRTLLTRGASTSRRGKNSTHNSLENLENVGQRARVLQADDKISDQTSGNSTSTDVGTALGLSNVNSYIATNCNNIYSAVSSFVPLANSIDDLHRLISFQQASVNQHNQQMYHDVENPNIVNNPSSQFSSDVQPVVVPQSQSLTFSVLPGGSVQAGFPDRLWEWNSITGAASKDYDLPFK